MTQVDGGAPGPVCSALVFPETAVYPPRDQIVDFRRQLGTKYQAMGRSAEDLCSEMLRVLGDQATTRPAGDDTRLRLVGDASNTDSPDGERSA